MKNLFVLLVIPFIPMAALHFLQSAYPAPVLSISMAQNSRDADGDWVLNPDDLCPSSFEEAVTRDGCTARQLLKDAWKLLPGEYDYVVRPVERLHVRLANAALEKALTDQWYAKNRSFLSCEGEGVFRQEHEAAFNLLPLACLVSAGEQRTLPVQEGIARFVSSSGHTFTIAAQGKSFIEVTDLGVVCNPLIKPSAFSALIRVINAAELQAKTALAASTCPNEQRGIQLLELARQSRQRGDALLAVSHYRQAWKLAECECS